MTKEGELIAYVHELVKVLNEWQRLLVFIGNNSSQEKEWFDI